MPRGSYVALRGQVRTMTSAYSQLYFGLAGAIVLIYLVIVVNFQSWLDPFIIITALPGALAGIVWMLFMTGTTLSVPALTGAIMCMGIATANSILLVSFAREGLAQGLDAAAAALEAGFTRFRPVLMTALAMIIGMLPMALCARRRRRAECAARPRRDRRPAGRDGRDAVFRSRRLQRAAFPARAEGRARRAPATRIQPPDWRTMASEDHRPRTRRRRTPPPREACAGSGSLPSSQRSPSPHSASGNGAVTRPR